MSSAGTSSTWVHGFDQSRSFAIEAQNASGSRSASALSSDAAVYGGGNIGNGGAVTAEAVARGECARGIVLGGSGNGEAMVANRVRGVRCALCWNVESARLARAHNDANMLSMGQRLVPKGEALAILEAWLTTPFDGGRHARRIALIDGG